jgi:2'-5' RNA ligase
VRVTGHSLLVVPLPGLVSVAPPLGGGVAVPHIPLVDPFTLAHEIDDGVVSELRAYFSDVVPFPVRLPALSQFPNGPAYLNPEPSAPFRQLALGVGRLFPELPRPRGTVDLVPHLTVPQAPGLTLDDLRDQLAPWLPLATIAREAALWWWDEDGIRTLATFTFGTSAA